MRYVELLRYIFAFLEIEDEDGVKNGTKLNPDYDPDDPETWTAETDWGETIGFFFEEIEDELRLTEVRCYDLGLVGMIDFEDCTELVGLYCGENMLDGVIVLGCTSLEILIPMCNEDLTELDVSQCPALYYLRCEDCAISDLDLSNNPELTDLYLIGNPLGELDVSCCPNLRNLDCMSCGLHEIDVSNNPMLESLYCHWNHISSIDISNNPLLQVLDCDGTDITELDTSANPELIYVTCCDNDIIEFDFTNNPNLVLDIVRAEEGGFIGCTVDDGLNDSIVIAEPWEGYEFVGWFDENDNLITTGSSYFTNGEERSVFIARFSDGPEPIPGDVDANGSVEAADAILTLRYAMHLLELTTEQLNAADMNGDGMIGLDDAIIILRIAMGLLS